MPQPKFSSVQDILNRSSKRPLKEFVTAQAGLAETEDVAYAMGFHVYAEIHLTLAIAAAESDKAAQKYLDILAAYGDIATAAASVAGARLLEVQGERLHFLIESNVREVTPSREQWARLFSLSRIVINACYERLENMAGADWRGCRVTADYGPAALLFTDCGGGSVVSLGNCANRPAKRLGQSPMVTAGHLAVPQELIPSHFGGLQSKGWIELDLRLPSQLILEAIGEDMSEAMRRFLDDAEFSQPARAFVRPASEQWYASINAGTQAHPVQMQGYVFRADLDGFTKQVQMAFSAGPEAVHALVRRFRVLLAMPARFADRLNARAILLPWAGDCATVLIVPRAGESFQQARSYLMVRAATEWHGTFDTHRQFAEAAGDARWALGLAAGDSNDGNEGRVLLAEIPAAGRTFRVVAGWNARRSSDAYQADNVVGGDTVTTIVDKRQLWDRVSALFSDIDEQFTKTTAAKLHRAVEASAALAATSQPTISSAGPTIPAPRPHYA